MPPKRPGEVWRYTRIKLMQMTGLTLDVIDKLSERDVNDIFAVYAAQEEVAKSKRKRK